MSINKINNIVKLKYKSDSGLGERAKIGIILLRSDQTLEYEFKEMLDLNGVALYHSRIDNDMEISEITLAKMEKELPRAVNLLPPSFNFDVIGYCCTSGTTIIGEEKVSKVIKSIHSEALITNPLSAGKAALNSLGIKNIGFITPYEPRITLEMRNNFLENGFDVLTIQKNPFATTINFILHRIKHKNGFTANSKNIFNNSFFKSASNFFFAQG